MPASAKGAASAAGAPTSAADTATSVKGAATRARGAAVGAESASEVTGTAAAAAPGDVYGPDDLAYGPPPPGWYAERAARDAAESTAAAESIAAAQTTGEQPVSRGPFEPLRTNADHASGQDGDSQGQDGASHPAPEQADGGSAQAAEDELPDRLDFGPPSDPEAGTLGHLRDLYKTAQALSPARLDRHFDQVLEKQHKLISDYFREAGTAGLTVPPGLAALAGSADSAAPVGAAALDGPSAPGSPTVPFGFDSAQSLSALANSDEARAAGASGAHLACPPGS
jgi:hypothetical protein